MSNALPSCVGLLLLSVAQVIAADPTAEEILGHLRSRREQVENLALEARWRDFRNGKPTGIETQVIHSDNLGRIRVFQQLDSDGTATREVDELYNGEITVTIDDDPNRNRMGEVHTEQTREAGERYRAAMIHDGLFPAGSGPSSHRNPFTFLDASRWCGDDPTNETSWRAGPYPASTSDHKGKCTDFTMLLLTRSFRRALPFSQKNRLEFRIAKRCVAELG